MQHLISPLEKHSELPTRLQSTQGLDIILQHHLYSFTVPMPWWPDEAHPIRLAVRFAYCKSRCLAANEQGTKIDVVELGPV